MKVVLLASLALIFCIHAVGATSSSSDLGVKSYCINELDSSFINKCHRQVPSNFLTMLANFAVQWINPRTLAISAVFFLIILPVLQFASIRRESGVVQHVLSKFLHNKIVILNFLHRVCYTLVLDVALYAVFRQMRPCSCTTDGGKSFLHFGSRYGMPSGDAMSGAIFGVFLFDIAPYHGWIARAFGIIVIPLICLERVVLGYHTIAQVTVGSSLGILLHYYSSRAPQFMIFFDGIIQIIAGAILLQLDPSLIYEKDSMNNLFSWYVWGVSFQIYVFMEIGRYYFNKKNIHKIRFSLQHLIATKQIGEEVAEHSIDVDHEKDTKYLNAQMDVTRLTDFGFTCISFTLMLLVNFFSTGIGQEGWLTKIH
ncbi:hypothetical protein C9374_006152 [Naegleria lovaniensis]|uniref:Phosphatidic acid phosphatase type 2/haloperoxidase domain-containing protein n=1 Tax=Naegleria lovaniensis TaxID=51637 RepID=A0AA88KJE8_NAELO|nr:uncharacterized protein C9374_006152 [Naegleria lovaniensis]KAG2381768.1 hypothetical protein C9374_006152 [Naegleria lovaniensis]